MVCEIGRRSTGGVQKIDEKGEFHLTRKLSVSVPGYIYDRVKHGLSPTHPSKCLGQKSVL